MQKNIEISESSKQSILKKIIENITKLDEVSMEMYMDKLMSDFPRQCIIIKIKKSGNFKVYDYNPAFEWY